MATFLLGGAAATAASPHSEGPATAAHPGADVTVTVSVGNGFSFSLSTDEIIPGDTVTVTMVSLGTQPHSFTLSAIPNFQFNSSDSTTHILAFFAVHPPLVNLSVNGTVGEKHSETFIAPAYGEYEYVCTQPLHFSEGMYGQLGSGEHGSSSVPDTGPGWQVFAIGGAIASLVVATLVLGFVVGARPGAHHEMPPERLGYPEQPTEPSAAPPSH